MESISKGQRAFELWQGNHLITWDEVAETTGQPSSAAACMSARRYASKHGLELRNGRTGADNPDRRRLSYCDYLLGWDWEEIAERHEWASANSAESSLRRWCARYNLPLARLP